MRYLCWLSEIPDKIVPSSWNDVFERDLCIMGKRVLCQEIILIIRCFPNFFKSVRVCECHMFFEMVVTSSWGDVFYGNLRAQGSRILHHKVILATWFS